MWFKQLTGFSEVSPEQVRSKLSVADGVLTSSVNGRSYICGALEILSLAELRQRTASPLLPARISLREIVANVQQLHANPANAKALFQVASQFNLLEMASPEVTPECGVGIYQHDKTQGPACAIAAGAGTIYRNYLLNVEGQQGQSASRQIDCLAGLGNALGNNGHALWQMQNGYALASASGLRHINRQLRAADNAAIDRLRARLQIGIQWQTAVTLENAKHTVSQAYCSALPVAYSALPADLWRPFATLVLEAAYEATLAAAVLNALQSGNRTVYLTQLGGGAFGNNTGWIVDALDRALALYQHTGIDVVMVSYGASNPALQPLLSRW